MGWIFATASLAQSQAHNRYTVHVSESRKHVVWHSSGLFEMLLMVATASDVSCSEDGVCFNISDFAIAPYFFTNIWKYFLGVYFFNLRTFFLIINKFLTNKFTFLFSLCIIKGETWG